MYILMISKYIKNVLYCFELNIEVANLKGYSI
nr:MAG TPA: hypothetical protein [Caudoviricetes sp.]